MFLLTFSFAFTTLSCTPTNITRTPIDQSPFPQLEFPDGRERDLGIVVEGSTFTTAFRIRNRSSEDITLLENVATSCGCTAGNIDNINLAPNEEATLTLTLSAATNEFTTKTLSATVFQKVQFNAPPVEIGFRFAYTTRPQWSIVFPRDSISGIAGSRTSLNAIVTRPYNSTVKFLNVKSRSPYLKSVTIGTPDKAISKEDTVIGNVQIEIEFPDVTSVRPVEFEFFTDDEKIPSKKSVLYIRSEAPVYSSAKLIRVNLRELPEEENPVLASELRPLIEGVKITGVSCSLIGLNPAIVDSNKQEASDNQKAGMVHLQVCPNRESLLAENVHFGSLALQYMNSAGHQGELIIPVIIQR